MANYARLTTREGVLKLVEEAEMNLLKVGTTALKTRAITAHPPRTHASKGIQNLLFLCAEEDASFVGVLVNLPISKNLKGFLALP